MHLFKLISHSKYLKNFIYFLLIFFFMNNLLNAKADKNRHLIRSSMQENKLKEFYSQNDITFSKHDNLDSQLKMFFGFDPENPETSFYPDLSIIDDSDFVRDMYKFKLNDMSIKN